MPSEKQKRPPRPSEEWVNKQFGPFGSSRFIRRQPRPYVKPLPYHASFAEAFTLVHNPYAVERKPPLFIAQQAQNYDHLLFQSSESRFHFNSLMNAATDRYRSNYFDTVDVMASLIEANKAIAQANTGLQLLINAYRSIKRRDFHALRKQFGKSPKRESGSQVANAAGATHLGYWFGIYPLMCTIQDHMNLFGESSEALYIKGTKKGGWSEEAPTDRVPSDLLWWTEWSVKIKKQASVRAHNVNEQLVTRLGARQPLRLIWELTPLSWAVDYWVNVGELLANYDPDLVGIKTEHEFTTIKMDVDWSHYWWPNWISWNGEPGYKMYKYHTTLHNRGLGVQTDYRLALNTQLGVSFKRFTYLAAFAGIMFHSISAKQKLKAKDFF